jgi:hypothetical protein
VPVLLGLAALLTACGTGPVAPTATAPAAPSLAAGPGGSRQSPGPDVGPPRPADDATAATPPAPRDLPRGGRTILPADRVVAFYGEGYPGGMGLLDVNDLDGVAGRIEQQAAAYARYGRPVLPAMELIATNAVRQPGPDGSYSLKLDDATVDKYLAAARRHRMLLILDFQPGTDEFLPQVERYEKYLTQPDVGIGLDPEWRTPGSRPYATTGSTTAAELNAVSSYVAGLARAHRLPQKLFIVHQFQVRGVANRSQVQAPKELAVVFHMDGVGAPGLKIGGYRTLQVSPPLRNGFKVFPTLDKPPMTPAQVMALTPQPEIVTYQ